MADNSRWKDIFRHLKQVGYAVYSPGQKKGECTSPYLVIRDAGASKAMGISSTIQLYEILIYLPENQYSRIEEYVRETEKAMDGMWPMLRPTHFKTTPFYDEQIKGWMTSIQYQNYQKNKRP